MNKTREKLILFDIDGTLYDNDNKEVPSATIEALRELKEYAHIGIATGRAEFMLYSIEEILDLFDDFVLINGQYIKASGEVIYESRLDISLLDRISKQMQSMNLAYGFQGNESEAISKLDEASIKSFEKLGLDIAPIDRDYYKTNPVYQAWVFCSEEDAKILEKDNPEFQFIRWLDVGYDILPKNVSKGMGVKRLAKHLNISMNDVIVFGDGDNDYEMIKEAGIGIAMGNATDYVKRVADYITDNVENDGIYKALKHFKLIK